MSYLSRAPAFVLVLQVNFGHEVCNLGVVCI